MHTTYSYQNPLAGVRGDSNASCTEAWPGRLIATSRLRAIKFFGYLPLQRSFKNKYCRSPNSMAHLQNGGDPKRILTTKPSKTITRTHILSSLAKTCRHRGGAFKNKLPFTKHHFTTHSAYSLKIRMPIQETSCDHI